MKTALLIIAIVVVVVMLIAGAFIIRQSRSTGDATQFAQLVSTLCIQAQQGMSTCSTLSAGLYQTPAAASGIPACATEYPPPLVDKFSNCVQVTLGIPQTSAAMFTQAVRDAAATSTVVQLTQVPTQTADAFIEKFRTDITHLCAGSRTSEEAEVCTKALFPLGIIKNEAPINACASTIPPLTQNTLLEDIESYVQCLNRNGLNVQIPK